MNEQCSTQIKRKIIKRNLDVPFILGSMDHSPQEIITPDRIYSSALIIYNTEFYKQFEALNITLKKWSSRGSYRQKFIKRWLLLQELPFYAFVATIHGKYLYDALPKYLADLRLSNIIEIIEVNGEKYHKYKIPQNEFDLKESISLGALYTAYFIISAYNKFKKFSDENSLQFFNNPFQIYHDKFPFDNKTQMGDIVGLLISLSLYHAYPTRVMSLYHWDTKYEMPDALLSDNIAGLFRYIAENKYSEVRKKEFLDSNNSVIEWINAI